MRFFKCPISYIDRVVGEVQYITCCKCKRCKLVCQEEICSKNSAVYYKTCIDCREKVFMKKMLKSKCIEIIK